MKQIKCIVNVVVEKGGVFCALKCRFYITEDGKCGLYRQERGIAKFNGDWRLKRCAKCLELDAKAK